MTHVSTSHVTRARNRLIHVASLEPKIAIYSCIIQVTRFFFLVFFIKYFPLSNSKKMKFPQKIPYYESAWWQHIAVDPHFFLTSSFLEYWNICITSHSSPYWSIGDKRCKYGLNTFETLPKRYSPKISVYCDWLSTSEISCREL